MKEASTTVTSALQQSLVDLIALELQSKQAHWNIRGASFRSLHLALDEVVAAARSTLDEVAERLGQVGGFPDGRAATVARDTILSEIDEGMLESDKAYQLMAEKVQQVSDNIKGFIEPVDEEDPVSLAVVCGNVAHAQQVRIADLVEIVSETDYEDMQKLIYVNDLHVLDTAEVTELKTIRPKVFTQNGGLI